MKVLKNVYGHLKILIGIVSLLICIGAVISITSSFVVLVGGLVCLFNSVLSSTISHILIMFLTSFLISILTLIVGRIVCSWAFADI